ncbi:MAG: hypothetical protein HYX51_06135 [Chloroflexi bacterium]|nr:hypothetical protein [Chloroflexota bacterium]
MHRIIAAITAGLFLIAAAAIAVTAWDRRDASAQQPAGQPTVGPLGGMVVPRATARPQGALSASQETRVTAIIAADSRIQQQAAGKPYRVSQVGPWLLTRPNQASVLIGAVASVVFDQLIKPPPAFDWPAIGPDLAGPANHPYVETTTRRASAPFRSLDVEIDLEDGRVVSVQPFD